jgi:hypothetical protein
MYFSAIAEQKMNGWRPYPNYLYAIAEWHLKRSSMPLEITARKIRKYYPQPEVFLGKLREALYEGFLLKHVGNVGQSVDTDPPKPSKVCEENATLGAVARLVQHKRAPRRGVRSVITYNYDSLLETVLPRIPTQAIFGRQAWNEEALPIYHVHGYVPLSEHEAGTEGDAIVFTEDQYHLVAQDPYGWSNIVQIQTLSSSVGLMIGLSLGDRNMRRLLDAISRAPVGSCNYAIISKPKWTPASDGDLDKIHRTAIKYLARFEKGSVKRNYIVKKDAALYQRLGVTSSTPFWSRGETKEEPIYRSEIRGILGEVERFDAQEQEFVLRQLGVRPILIEKHTEIPEILRSITEGSDDDPRA